MGDHCEPGSEQFFREFVETTSDLVTRVDADGCFIYVNRVASTIFGLDAEACIGLDAFSFVHVEDRERTEKWFHKCIRQHRRACTTENRQVSRTGDVRDTVWTSTFHYTEDGAVSYVTGIARDVTEQKKAEARQRQLIAIMEETSDFVSTATPEGQIVYVNRAARQMVGWGSDDALHPKQIIDAHPAWAYRIVKEEGIPTAMRDGLWRGETALVAPDGREIPTSQVIMSHRSTNGTLEFLSTIIRDISEQKAAEERILKEKSLSEAYINSLPGVFYVVTPDARFVRWNKEWEEVTGYSAEEMARLPATTFFRGKDKEHIEERIAKVFREGEAEAEAEINTKDGRRVPYYFTGQRREFDGKPHLIGLGMDITDRRLVEAQVLKEQQLSEAYINSLPGMFYVISSDGHLVRWNRFTEEITGRTPDEVRATPALAFFDAEDQKNVEERISEVFSTGYATVEARLIGQNGQRIPYLMSGVRREFDGRPYLVGMGIDITERKKARQEQQLLQEQLQQSQKLEAIGKLAGGIAHDFNNMLGGIVGATELLKQHPSRSPDTDRYFDLILQTAERASELTDKLLTFARKKRTASMAVDIHGVLGDTVALLQNTIDRRIRIMAEFGAEHSTVIGDASQLQNVFINLGINASHAMPEGGRLIFRTRMVTLDADACSMAGLHLEPGKYMEIETQDTGCGISSEDLPRIFDPFFTSKRSGRGTGLGLAAAYGTIQQHHGAITVESELKSGTSFRIWLPLSRSSADRTTHATDQGVVPGSGLVLLVDDESIIRTTSKSILECLGYDVLLAENGRQGVELYRENRDRIKVVIVDMIMPEMNGRDCFAALQEIDPNVRVILASGYIQDQDVQQMEADGLRGYISKPFRTAVLSQAIEDALRD